MLELQYLFDADRTEDSYLSAIEGKTASLMATSCRVGGMVSNVSADTLDALTQFGHHLGMCFQVVDDVLDVTRTEAELGKPAGNDVHEGVYTLPVIYALQSDRGDELRALLGRKLERAEVEQVVALVATPDIVDASMAVARTHATKATEALAGATELDADVCDRLRTLVDGLVRRSLVAVTRSREDARASSRAASTRGSRQDVDAYVDCWHRRHGHRDAVGRDRRRGEVPQGSSKRASRGRRRSRSTCTTSRSMTDATIVLADWTIRARRRDDDVTVEWRGLSVCEFRDGQIAWWREHHLAPPGADLIDRAARSGLTLTTFGARRSRARNCSTDVVERVRRLGHQAVRGAAQHVEPRASVISSASSSASPSGVSVSCEPVITSVGAVIVWQLEAQLVGHVEDRVDLRDERVRLRLHRARARAR